MKNEIAIFKNDLFGEVRVAELENGEPLFCLADLCNAIGLSNPSSVKGRLDKEDVQLIDLHTLKSTKGESVGNTMTNFVNESGLYDVLLQSSSTKVRPFRKWVTSEVLPSLRKTGGYIMARLDETPDMIMARAILVARETMDRMKKQLYDKDLLIAKQAPKVSYADRVLEHDNQMVDVGQASKLLKLPYGRNTFFAKLREDGIFFKNRNEPIQEYVDRKYFDVRKVEIPRENHPGFTVLKVLVTPKGLYWLSKKYGGDYKTNIPSLQLQ